MNPAARAKGECKSSLLAHLRPIEPWPRNARGRRKRRRPELVDCLTAARRAVAEADQRRASDHAQRYVLPKIARDIGQVELLHRRRAIDDQQRSAAEKLASLYEHSGFKPQVTAAYMGGIKAGGGMPGHGPTAPEYVQAMAAVSPALEGVVFAVVIEDHSASSWALVNGVPQDAGIVLLRKGLDNLAYHFRYKTPPRGWDD